MRRIADFGFAFLHQPAGAQQRVTETQANTAQHGKRTQPPEIATRVVTIGDRQSFDQGSDHQALGECGDKRSANWATGGSERPRQQ